MIGLDATTPCLPAPRQGVGIEEILEAVVQRVPPPTGDPEAPLRALIFDSWFDPYRGVIILSASSTAGCASARRSGSWSTGGVYEVEGLGYQSPKPVPCDELSAGEAGFLFANIKTVSDAKIGDTITDARTPAAEPLPGFQEIKPMVFAGSLSGGISRTRLASRCARKTPPERQRIQLRAGELVALGFGFRCGFLGLLHMEIIQERLEREFNIDLITTAPGVRYQVTLIE